MVETLAAEVGESTSQLKWLEERERQNSAENKELEDSIAQSQQLVHMRANGTKDVFKLKG